MALQKLTSVPKSEAPKIPEREPNHPPPNLKEVTELDFARSHFFRYHPDFVEWMQVLPQYLPEPLRTEQKGMLAIQCYWFFDGTGVALASEWFRGKVRYFTFAVCEHETAEKPSGRMFDHVHQCTKCGFVYVYDSSG